MATHAERLDNLEEKIEQLKEKEEDPEQFVSALLKDVFSKLGENHAGDLVGYISQQIDNYILENYISKTDLENYLSKEDIGDVVKEICDLLQTEVGVNTTFLEKKIENLLSNKK